MLTADSFIAAARTYIGVPWQHQGRSRHGIDCVGLLVCVAHDLGIPVDDGGPNYEREPRAHDLARLLRRHCESMPDMRRGYIVLMGRPSTHVGFLTQGNPFGLIHVPTNGACVEVRFDPEIHRLRGTYRPLLSRARPWPHRVPTWR